jgi:RNA recognition motif-containing protein
VAIITDRDTGQSKGFGFVTMTEGADKPIAQLSGSELNGRMLTVNEAKPLVKRDFGGGGRGDITTNSTRMVKSSAAGTPPV